MAKEELIVGGGCFWCTEAVFSTLKGVLAVESGYANGDMPNPNYRMICTGTSGYAEVIKITYDESIITTETLLDVFFTTHNPTTLNYQGADRGTQYRSTVLYQNEAQKEIAKQSVQKAQESWSEPIVTVVESLHNYYKAEAYHQDYFANNPTQGYCQATIPPKLKKLKEKFHSELK